MYFAPTDFKLCSSVCVTIVHIKYEKFNYRVLVLLLNVFNKN